MPPTIAPQPNAGCPITVTLSVIGGKWTPVLVYLIGNGINRFGSLRRSVPGISKQMLTKQLRELEGHGLITRQIFAEVPPRVEYSITGRGRSLFPIIAEMRVWGERYLAERSD